MEHLWIGVFAVLLLGYFALEGFSIGTGLLLPFTGRDERERGTVVAGLGPYFLANEVWLVAVIGVFFGVFPVLEGSVLTALYPLVVGFLLAWILRDAGLWMRARREGAGWRRTWDRAIFAGSLGMATSWGAALANLALGVPLDHGSQVAALPLFNLYALFGAVALTALLAAHGAVFLARRVDGAPGTRAASLARSLVPLAAVLLPVVVVTGAVLGGADAMVVWIAGVALLGTAVLVAAHRLLAGGSRDAAFAATAFGATVPIQALLVGVHPLLRDSLAHGDTLWILTIVVGPVLPLLALAQVWLWRAFRGTVDHTTPSYL
ncbi:cytochrome d ubiquinol oxidase subunit II [Nocardiopsis alba]|uniref:cytochrome d ubiquinol oxidase subunit II n=1 Tax=Nocardiopsis alba TaxID=53437 RepID=UPI0033A3FBBE